MPHYDPTQVFDDRSVTPDGGSTVTVAAQEPVDVSKLADLVADDDDDSYADEGGVQLVELAPAPVRADEGGVQVAAPTTLADEKDKQPAASSSAVDVGAPALSAVGATRVPPLPRLGESVVPPRPTRTPPAPPGVWGVDTVAPPPAVLAPQNPLYFHGMSRRIPLRLRREGWPDIDVAQATIQAIRRSPTDEEPYPAPWPLDVVVVHALPNDAAAGHIDSYYYMDPNMHQAWRSASDPPPSRHITISGSARSQLDSLSVAAVCVAQDFLVAVERRMIEVMRLTSTLLMIRRRLHQRGIAEEFPELSYLLSEFERLMSWLQREHSDMLSMSASFDTASRT